MCCQAFSLDNTNLFFPIPFLKISSKSPGIHILNTRAPISFIYMADATLRQSQTWTDHLWSASCIFESFNNLILMICAKSHQCNLKLHSRISVSAYKLVMIQLDNIALRLGDHACHTYQFTRLIWNEHRYCEDSVSLDQTMLNNRRHGNNIHVSTA